MYICEYVCTYIYIYIYQILPFTTSCGLTIPYTMLYVHAVLSCSNSRIFCHAKFVIAIPRYMYSYSISYHAYMCIYMYIYIYIYIYTYTQMYMLVNCIYCQILPFVYLLY